MKIQHWTVIDKNTDRPRHWLCRCVCGKTRLVFSSNITHRVSASCGCQRKTRLTHGMRHTATYNSWASMIQRCTATQSKMFQNYGARGITVCERWLTFENFFSDMGRRPSIGHTLNRLDNNAGYFKENCAWSTKTEQARNRRSSRLVTYNGLTDCVAGWAERLRIPLNVLDLRLRAYRWTIERAFTQKVRYAPPRKKHHG